MGVINYGSQNMTFQYKEKLKAYEFNHALLDLLPVGIYKGGTINKIDDLNVTIDATTLYIENRYDTLLSPKLGVKVQTTITTVNIPITSTTEYIIARMEWSNVASNYCDFLTVAVGDILSTDVVLAKANFSGLTLDDFDYTVKTIGNLEERNDARYVNVSGDTMTGPLIVPDATADNHALNRITADNRYLSSASDFVSKTGDTMTGALIVEDTITTTEAFITPSCVNLGLNNTITALDNNDLTKCIAIGDEADISVGVTDFLSLNQEIRDWRGMTTAPNGDVYVCVNSGSIYKQTGGLGDFVTLSQTSRFWYAMTAASNGDIYACVNTGDIYKQIAGVGNFVSLSQTSRQWHGMTTAPNGDIYACANSGDIYKQTGGVGNFIALGQTTRNWHGMTATSNGDVYACSSGDIYKQTGGVGNFIALGQTTRDWRGLTTAPNGDVYACVGVGGIYKQTAGLGDFISLDQTSRDWRGITAVASGEVYSCESGGEIYKQTDGSAIQIGKKSGTTSGANSISIGNNTDAVSDGSIVIGDGVSTDPLGGSNQINILDRFKYFELPSTTTRGDVYDLFIKHIYPGVGATVCIGRIGNGGVNTIAVQAADEIRFYYESVVSTAPYLSALKNSVLTLGLDLQIAMISYINV